MLTSKLHHPHHQQNTPTHTIDHTLVKSIVSAEIKDSTCLPIWESFPNNCHTSIPRCLMDFYQQIRKSISATESVLVMEPRLISQTPKRWEQYLGQNIKTMRKTQFHISVRRIIQRLRMGSSINTTNGKEPVIKAWRSIFIWEIRRDQVLILNKNSFTCLQRIKHPSFLCLRVIEVCWLQNIKKHQALECTTAMSKRLNLDQKQQLLQCLKPQEMCHSQNIVPIIQPWSAKDCSEQTLNNCCYSNNLNTSIYIDFQT